MRAYRRVTREDLEEAGRLRASKWTLQAIADHQGTTSQDVARRLKRLKETPTQTTCALPECGALFWPMRKDQLYCTRLHAKRDQMRRSADVDVAHQQCELPGCLKQLFRRGQMHRFCSDNHSDAFSRGVRRGLYARLLGVGPQCIACEERLVLDEHHVEHPGGRSNKEGPVVWLCPTHHAAIHRGVAEIVEGQYRSRAPFLLDQFRAKHPALVAEILTPGYTWADKS